MPIRIEASERLTRDIFGAFIGAGLVSEQSIKDTAAIIRLAVSIDEREARIAALEAELAAKEKA